MKTPANGLFLGLEDSICALATAPGFGGVAVIRVSGKSSFSICSYLLKKPSENKVSHRAYLEKLFDREGNQIDQALVTFFREGKSFTGEDVVEISCHGSPYLTQRILMELIHFGARMAQPGEFSYRAFQNGKMDLLQAESLLGLIRSRTKTAADLALRNLSGGLSKEILYLESEITWGLAHLEANIDFSSEGLDLLSGGKIHERLKRVLDQMRVLVESYRFGNLCMEGIQVAIVGRPNVGKSTLFNLLVGEDRAIVSDLPGTTRDFVEAETMFHGQLIRFIDTAGLRTDASDIVEKLGIERTMKRIQNVEFRLLVLDSTNPNLDEFEADVLKSLNLDQAFVVLNKVDISSVEHQSQLLKQAVELIEGRQKTPGASISDFVKKRVLKIEAKNESFKNQLLEMIGEVGRFSIRDEEGLAIFNSRQYEGLLLSMQFLEEGLELLGKRWGEEIVTIPLRKALLEIQKLHGTHYDDQILDRVFKEFCLGK